MINPASYENNKIVGSQEVIISKESVRLPLHKAQNTDQRIPSFDKTSAKRQDIHRKNCSVIKPKGIEDLPTELIQKIAGELVLPHYINFRATSKRFHNSLESVMDLHSKYKQGNCTEKVKEKLRNFFWFERLDNDIREALFNTKVFKDKDDGNYIAITTAYNPEGTGKRKRIHNAISLWTRRLLNITHVSAEFHMFNSLLGKENSWRHEVHICAQGLSILDMDKLFSTTYNIFKNTKGDEKLVMAIFATKLKDYWCRNPPKYITKKDVMEITDRYSALFNPGRVLKKFYPNLK